MNTVMDLLQATFGPLVFLFTVSNLAAMGLQVRMPEVVAALRNKKSLALIFVWGWVLGPAFGYLITRVLPLEQPYVVVVLLESLAPCAPFLQQMVGKARGDMGFAGALIPLVAVGTVVLMPLMAPLLINGVTISTSSLAKPLLLTILLPLVIGAAIRHPNLGTLLSAIPNARVIQLHRNPTTCLTSANSMFYSAHRAVTHDINVQRMAEINKQMYTHYLEGGQKSRSDSAVNNAVLDVQYDQLVKDPMQTVKDIYAHFGVPWSDEYEESLKSFLSNHPKDKHGAHHYTPEQFGQSADELNAHFASVSDDVRMSTEK